jgi:hypothetical protein
MGRPSSELSLLGVPSANFFCRRAAPPENATASGAPSLELVLRYALSAPPFGLRRAPLRASSRDNNKNKTKTKKGDISILARKGTFLFWFDIV